MISRNRLRQSRLESGCMQKPDFRMTNHQLACRVHLAFAASKMGNFVCLLRETPCDYTGYLDLVTTCYLHRIVLSQIAHLPMEVTGNWNAGRLVEGMQIAPSNGQKQKWIMISRNRLRQSRLGCMQKPDCEFHITNHQLACRVHLAFAASKMGNFECCSCSAGVLVDT